MLRDKVIGSVLINHLALIFVSGWYRPSSSSAAAVVPPLVGDEEVRVECEGDRNDDEDARADGPRQRGALPHHDADALPTVPDPCPPPWPRGGGRGGKHMISLEHILLVKLHNNY